MLRCANDFSGYCDGGRANSTEIKQSRGEEWYRGLGSCKHSPATCGKFVSDLALSGRLGGSSPLPSPKKAAERAKRTANRC